MTNTDFTSRQHLARHEAAHAVVTHDMGIVVDSAEIVDVVDDYSRGRCNAVAPSHPADLVAMLLAGYLQNRIDGQSSELARDVAWSDVQQIEELRDSMGYTGATWWRMYMNAARHAHVALRASQDTIARVGAALAAAGKLDAAAMGSLLAVAA